MNAKERATATIIYLTGVLIGIVGLLIGGSGAGARVAYVGLGIIAASVMMECILKLMSKSSKPSTKKEN